MTMMVKLQYNSAEQQRRPSRISGSICGVDSLALNGNDNRNCRMLKCSTITKVPPAKSRLKQPVASLLVPAHQTNAENAHKETAANQKPSRLARLSTATNRARPTSLSLKNIASNVRVPSQTIIPASSSSSSSSRRNSRISTLPQPTPARRFESVGSPRTSSCSIGQDVNKTSITQTKTQPMQSTMKRKSSITNHKKASNNITSLISPIEARSNNLKNLAVVHPQHSLRGKSSATATNTFNNLSPTTAKSIPSPASNHLSNGKNEIGKVNSHHHKVVASRRDVGEFEARSPVTSKQDESQISGRHLQTNLSKQKDASLSNISNGISLISSSSLPAENEKTNDEHYVEGNNANHLPPLQVNKAASKVEMTDKKQHGNIKQSNKHSAANISTMTTVRSVNGGTKSHRGNATNSNNCLFHDSASKLAQINEATNHFKHNNSSNRAINDRILPKPLGQQVLSLMMLDVGLMPSNNHLQQQQQQISRSDEAHVRIQGPTLKHVYDEQLTTTVQNTHSDCGRSGSFSSERAIANGRSNRHNSLIDFETNNDDQCNNYCCLQPSLEMLRLQLRLSREDNESSRSISLPTSPRIRIRGHKEERIVMEQQFGRAKACDQETSTILSADSACRSTSWMVKNDSTKLSPVPIVGPKTKLSDQNHLLNLVCDSQESHSLTSSSSSSLNHYPPLLALSNQLNGFEFDELVKTNVDKTSDCKQTNISVAVHGDSSKQDKITVDSQSDHTSRQHEVLTSDPNDYEFESYPGEINHLKECARYIKRMEKPEEYSENPNLRLEQSENSQLQLKGQCYDDESCANPQFRRQQARSHSISGQEYHFNAGYQRSKQTSYTRPGALENYMQFNNQSSNLVNQNSYSYQQPQQMGRSPSPLNTGSQTHYGSPLRDVSIKYPQDRQPRKQLHSSLECLNSGYSDYQHQMQQYHNQTQYHQNQIKNQHYAASYVLTQPPANTIINQNGDQDLAAAAMGTPPSQYHQSIATNIGSNGTFMNNYNQQSLISRAMSQVSQSASRRTGYTNTQGTGSSLLNHLTNLHPMRAGHSSLSLASSSYMIEDKLQNEIRKLQSELKSEKEKNEALNSQLNINSSLMAAFEQSLTTLNTRLRQLTTLNEKKDNEIDELRIQLNDVKISSGGDKNSKSGIEENNNQENERLCVDSEKNSYSENNLLKIIEELRRQLIEKDRLLTDTRLEALSAAHQLEQLESKLNGEHSMLPNEDDLDEGVMVANHSPSDSDAITDPAHFNDITSQIRRANQMSKSDNVSFTQNGNENNNNDESNGNNITDNQSNHSSDYSIEVKTKDQGSLGNSISQQFNESDSGVMDRLMDSLLSAN